MKTSTLWIALLLVLGAVGCGSSSLMTRGPQTSSEVEELKRRVLELQKQSTVHELEMERLRRRIEELEGGSPMAGTRAQPRTGSSSRAAENAPPPARPPVRTREQARMREEPPPPVYRQPEIEQSDLDVEGFGQEVEPPMVTEPGSAPPSVAVRNVPAPGSTNAPDPKPRAAITPVPAAAQALYDEGYTYYHQGRFVDAESAFRRFLQGYGTTDLADNAQYWIGESRYARKDYQAALAAFRETVERFPDGNKVPDALIKAGQCFEALGDDAAAAETYREVVRRFPSSAASVAAAEYLDKVR